MFMLDFSCILLQIWAVEEFLITIEEVKTIQQEDNISHIKNGQYNKKEFRDMVIVMVR